MSSELDLLLPDTENEAGAPQGAPRIIERSPRNLIGEARLAFDAGLLISCLTVLVTIPDVCSNLIDSSNRDGQRNWCTRYLGFPNTPVVDDIDRSRKQSRDHIERTMNALMREDNFTASDFCQLRNAVLHTGSSVVDGSGQNSRRFIRSVYRSSTTIVNWSSDMASPAHQGLMGLRTTAA